jgi:hypothetical protein
MPGGRLSVATRHTHVWPRSSAAEPGRGPRRGFLTVNQRGSLLFAVVRQPMEGAWARQSGSGFQE